MQAFTEGATVPDDARANAERIFREVFSVCLSGDALEKRIRETLHVWDADRHGHEHGGPWRPALGAPALAAGSGARGSIGLNDPLDHD